MTQMITQPPEPNPGETGSAKPEETRRYSARANGLYRVGAIGAATGSLVLLGAIGYDTYYNPQFETTPLTARVEMINEEIFAINNRSFTFRDVNDIAFRDSLTARVNSLQEERARIETSEEMVQEEEDYNNRMNEYKSRFRKIAYTSAGGLVFACLSLIPACIGVMMRKREDEAKRPTREEEKVRSLL